MLILRNDDVAADTPIEELTKFCEICDKHGVYVVHSIILIGNWGSAQRPGHASWGEMSDAEIKRISGDALFSDNRPVVEFLKARPDGIAVHGLRHTRDQSEKDIRTAKGMLEKLGLRPQFFVAPWNETRWKKSVAGLEFLIGNPHLNEYKEQNPPANGILFTHSWCFQDGNPTWQDLDAWLGRLARD